MSIKFSLLLMIAAFALGSCHAPGFPERRPGSPSPVEVTLEATHTTFH